MGSTTRRRRCRGTADHTALLGRLHAGDTDAFDRLYREQVAAVTHYVAARLGRRDRDGVDDCVHDAFCAALDNPALIDADVRGSLLRLAARAVTRYSQSQRRYRRAAYTIYEDTGCAVRESATEAASTTAPRMRISQALAGLSDDQRRVLRLRYLDGRPRAAVAAAMRRTVNAVRVLERQAVARLTANLADHTLATADSGAATPAVPARPA